MLSPALQVNSLLSEPPGKPSNFPLIIRCTVDVLLIQGTTITKVADWLHLSEAKDDGPENFGVDIPDELNTIMQQEVVQKDAYLKDYPLNEGTLVMIVERNQKYIVPNGKLLLKKGDKLLLISAKNDETVESKKTHSMLEMISNVACCVC